MSWRSMLRERLAAAGEHGAMCQAARYWAETGALLCEVLAAEMDSHRHSSPHTAPAVTTAGSQSSREQQQSGSLLQQAPCDHSMSNGGLEAHEKAVLVDTEQGPISAENTADWHRSEGDLSMSQSAQMHSTDGHATQHSKFAAQSGCTHRRGTQMSWPDIVPADGPAQSAGSTCVPEPPTEFASVLCATWHALAPGMTFSEAAAAASWSAAEQEKSSLPSSMPYQQDSNHHSSSGRNTPLSMRLKASLPPADDAVDPQISAGTETAAAGSDAAGNEQHVSPQGLRLDFRLLGEPAGFASCHAQPSSRPELRAALASEVHMSGPPLLGHAHGPVPLLVSNVVLPGEPAGLISYHAAWQQALPTSCLGIRIPFRCLYLFSDMLTGPLHSSCAMLYL